jgi:hypothetical protein
MKIIDKQAVDAVITEIRRQREVVRIAEEDARRRLRNEALNQYAVKVPCRVVGMRMLTPDNREDIVPTILPPMQIMLPKASQERVPTERIRYTLDNPKQSGLPLAHIFRSGGVCFGTVPVPSTVHRAQCLRPLDILLGYNDRVTSHGGARFTPSEEQRQQLEEFCTRIGVKTPTSRTANWIDSDVPWAFCYTLLNTFDEETALSHAAEFYNILWGTPTTSNPHQKED